MDINNLLNDISEYSEKQKEIKKQIEFEKYRRIDDLKDTIESKNEKIAELIKLGNHALKNNIIFRPQGFDLLLSSLDRKHGYFFTDGIYHYLGFIWNHEQHKITHLGIQGGGACNYNLKVNEEELEVTGNKEYILTRFIEELDEFEEDLINYITKKVKTK